MSMADMPEGAELIDNPISVAPGFRIENVYVLPGVPKIMQAMLDGLLPSCARAPKCSPARSPSWRRRAMSRRPGSAIQARFRARDRQLPVLAPGGPGTTIVLRGTDQAQIDAAAAALLELAARLNAETRENPTSG